VDLGAFLYIVITNYHLLALFTFLQTTIFYHSIRLILCSQQTGEIDNLSVSWDKVLGCVVCRFHVAAGAKLSPRQVFWRHLSHPKIWNVKINGNHVACLNLKFHKELKLFDLI
jgi:hypothetical protein